MSELFLGGPDRPPRFLRDLLQERVETTPAGGRVDWATYYFRDRALAQALMTASDRGVEVTLHVEGLPRRAGANREVLSLLRGHGLRGGLHVHEAGTIPKLHPHLHSKIYAFSGPEPLALVGSFNPSGDDPEDPQVVAEIGDQDRGHNILVGLKQPEIVSALQRHVRAMGGSVDRFRPGRTFQEASTSLFFYPRLRSGIIDTELKRIGSGARIKGAISHLKNGSFTSRLIGAARKGAAVELLVHDTERRVPQDTVKNLLAAGVEVRRYARKDGLPLHAKFLLVEEQRERTAWFGSFNFNPRSRYLNHELLVRSADRQLWEALSTRFDHIAAEIGGDAQ